MKGYFITLEGVEGSGKTTLIKWLYSHLTELGFDVVTTREPGGIPIAEEIRKVILHPEHTTMDGRTEALLYAAARRQHLIEKVSPALNEGKIVLCDRFIDSSLAYQGVARGLGIDEVLRINEFAIESYNPDLTLYLQLDPEVGLERIQANDKREKNRLDMEAMSFHQLVYGAYEQLKDIFQERIVTIDADQATSDLGEDALKVIRTCISESIS